MRKPKALILCIIADDFGLHTRKALLQDNGYEVLTAQSGQKGLRLFVAYAIDVTQNPKTGTEEIRGKLGQ
jgi:hypothetical protein